MAVAEKQRTKDWVDRKEYPFESHYIEVDGGRMHYVDEGQGPPVVFVHGNPTWSYLFRGMISDLSIRHRCIAMDHIGFGLSDKPEHWGYSPELHARNFAKLIEHLSIPQFTLVVHGSGGPIGLSYAVENPAHVSGLAVINSWMWSLSDHGPAKKYDRSVSNPIGKLNYTFSNPAASLISKAILDKLKFPSKALEPYKHPFDNAKERLGPYGMAKGLMGSSIWLTGLWARRQVLEHKPGVIIWGMQDKLFTPEMLPRWRSVLPNARVEELSRSGHFAIEEEAHAVEAALYMFLDGKGDMSAQAAELITLTHEGGFMNPE